MIVLLSTCWFSSAQRPCSGAWQFKKFQNGRDCRNFTLSVKFSPLNKQSMMLIYGLFLVPACYDGEIFDKNLLLLTTMIWLWHFRTLLLKLVEKGLTSKHPQLMLRRTESIVEKMLTNWLVSFHLYHRHHKSNVGSGKTEIKILKSNFPASNLIIKAFSLKKVFLKWESFFSYSLKHNLWIKLHITVWIISLDMWLPHFDSGLFAGALLVRLHEGLRWFLPLRPLQGHQVPGDTVSTMLSFSSNVSLSFSSHWLTFLLVEISIVSLS